jgi:hypothetical protein
MLEKLTNLIKSLNLNNIVQGILFALLLLSVYWFIPGITLVLAPFALIGIGVQYVYNFIVKKQDLKI